MKKLTATRAVYLTTLIIFVMSLFIATCSKTQPTEKTWTNSAGTKWTDREERSHLQRVSRASSRSVIASASTTTTVQMPSPSTTERRYKHPTTTVPSPDTVLDNTQENSPGGISTEAYRICFGAAASVKGAKVAPNIARWIDLVVRFFPNEVAKTCRTMACESGGYPNAVGPRQPNGSYPQGLMQILGGPFDPEANLQLAAAMRAQRGWQPWSACA